MGKTTSRDAKNAYLYSGKNAITSRIASAKSLEVQRLQREVEYNQTKINNYKQQAKALAVTSTSVNVSESTPKADISLGATDALGTSIGIMDDNNSSNKMIDSFPTPKSENYLVMGYSTNSYGKLLHHSNNMFSERERNKLGGLFEKTYRFGYYNTNTVSTGKEFLFFTKPDLNIVSGNTLQPFFADIPFWVNLVRDKPRVIHALQFSANLIDTITPGDGYDEASDVFNHLLQNQVVSSLDIPSLSAQMTETPVNDYGVGYNYRGSSEGSDDNPEFSLEFKDNKWLDTYMFFKAYEMYETMKHHGQVTPKMEYITNRIIHDAFSIYKFIVAEDMETIVYFGKMYGVTPKSLPRDSFSNATFDNGITYNIDFQAAFYEDMIPDIIADFNALSYNYYNAQPYRIDIYNERLGMADGRAARAAIVVKEDSKLSPAGFVYKLKWRGDDVV